MKHLLYSFMIIFTIIHFLIEQGSSLQTRFVVMILILIIILIIKERFLNNHYFSIFLYFILCLYVLLYPYYRPLLSICILDCIYQKKYFLLPFIGGFILYLLTQELQIELLLFYIFFAIFGYLLNKKEAEKKNYLLTIDNERSLRYELETTKHQLIQYNHEIERLTEIKERNRIARNIHDDIGHDIAGVLFQLQAASKINIKNQVKAQEILALCIDKLSLSLNVLRDTVYNIKPQYEINETYFKDIIKKFVFCPIDFNIEGNINDLTPMTLEILATNLKESLTNASKYSSATKITIKIQITTNFVRYFYQDNGKGCSKIVDGLGFSGMKDRLKSISGMINIDGSDGFKIITVIPLNQTTIFK